MIKDAFVAVIGKSNYVRYVMFLGNLYHAMLPFRHPAAPLMRGLFIPRGGVVLDIGANIGRCTALAARAVGPSGRVFSFEPVPMVLRVLRAMLRLRRYAQVSVSPAALADREGTAEISVPLKDGWKPLVPIAHLRNGAEADVLTITIPLQTLDGFLAAHGVPRVDFIKCDTEGSEYAVFSGGRGCLARDLPTVVCEVYQSYMARQGAQPAELFGLFTALGYTCYFIEPDGRLREVPSYGSAGDYLFAHASTLDPSRLRPYVLATTAS